MVSRKNRESFAESYVFSDFPFTKVSHSDIITEIHTQYFNAGSNVVCANTFGANLLNFAEDELELIIEAAIKNAKAAKNNSNTESTKFVALDMGEKCISLMNTGVYGSHFENDALYMSLVRGVTYCAHPIGERELIPNDRFTKKIDQGENNYSFRLTVTDRGQ